MNDHSYRYWLAEAGVAYLKWAADFKVDDDWPCKNGFEIGAPTPQALAAQEILLLYQWWKHDRPNRSDPMKASGWDEYCEKHPRSTRSLEDKEVCKDILNICQKMEKEQEDEDTDMLIRLVKIRKYLWT